MIAGYYRNLI